MSLARRLLVLSASAFVVAGVLVATAPQAAILGGGKGGGIGGILGYTQLNHALAGTGITFGRVTDDNSPPRTADAIRVRPSDGIRDGDHVIPVTTIRIAMLSQRGAVPWGTFVGRRVGEGLLSWELDLATVPADGLLFVFGDRKYWLAGDACSLSLDEDPTASLGGLVIAAVNGLDDDSNGTVDFERADRVARDHGFRILGDKRTDGCEVDLISLPQVGEPQPDSVGTLIQLYKAIQDGDAALQAQLNRDPGGTVAQSARIDVLSMPSGGLRIAMGGKAWRIDAAADALVLVPVP